MRRRTTATEAVRGTARASSPGGYLVLSVLASTLLTACIQSFLPPPPAGAPGSGEAQPGVGPERTGRPPSASPAGDWAPGASDDPILASPWTRDGEIRERIDWWVDYWRTRARDRFVRALVRMGRYEDFVDAEVAARGLPPSLRYLPIIEASYYPLAESRAGAAGLWQFMPGTARWLGLTVNSLVDHRFDPYLATPLALDYLADLQEQFDSWFLALAAYNAGPGRVERAIRDHGGGDPRGDALFRRIRDRLPPETRDFVPKYFAAVRIASDPASFGLTGFTKDPPWTFDEVTIEGAASIDVVAAAGGAPEERVRELNPHLVLGLTPAGTSTPVRLPRGAGSGFTNRFAAIPPGERVTFTEHTVAAGETLSHIARNYRVSVDELRAANPAVEPTRMQIGTRLVIPRVRAAPRPAVEAGNRESPRAEPPPARVRERSHTVKRGDSLWLIARLHGVELERLRAYNGLAADAVIQPGDEIRIPPKGQGG